MKKNLLWFGVFFLVGLFLVFLISPERFYNKLGYYGWKFGLYNWSIKSYTKAIEHNPQYVKAYRNRGVALYDIEQNDLAVKDYDQAIKIDPSSALTFQDRGLAHMWLGHYDLAEKDFKRPAQWESAWT